MEKVVIFGGSFDPVHKGHLQAILKLSESFDRVIVSPGFVTPFKTGEKPADANDRLNMLKIALDDTNAPWLKQDEIIETQYTRSANIEISDYEINKGGISYSADVVRYYSYKNVQIYFAVGSEGAKFLHLWRESEFLKDNVIFYIIPRKGYPVSLSGGFKCEIAPYEIEDVSSSLFKAAHALGFSGDMVTKGVYEYIVSNGLYCDYKHIADGLKLFGLDQQRINHTFGAVKAGIVLAKTHDENVDKAVTALMLHDIAKNATTEVLAKHGIKVSDLQAVPQPCRHAIIGEQIAKQYFKIKDTDILNAVRYHTTGRPNMSRLEKIVALADYIEEGRQFEGRQEVFNLAMTNLNKAMAVMLQNVTHHLAKNGKEIFDISLKALCFYKDLVYNN